MLASCKNEDNAFDVYSQQLLKLILEKDTVAYTKLQLTKEEMDKWINKMPKMNEKKSYFQDFYIQNYEEKSDRMELANESFKRVLTLPEITLNKEFWTKAKFVTYKIIAPEKITTDVLASSLLLKFEIDSVIYGLQFELISCNEKGWLIARRPRWNELEEKYPLLSDRRIIVDENNFVATNVENFEYIYNMPKEIFRNGFDLLNYKNDSISETILNFEKDNAFPRKNQIITIDLGKKTLTLFWKIADKNYVEEFEKEFKQYYQPAKGIYEISVFYSPYKIKIFTDKEGKKIQFFR